MRKLSDEEKARLQAKIGESQRRKTDRIALVVIAIFAILGGLAGFFLVAAGDSEWVGPLFLLMCVAKGAAVGAIIGLFLFYLAYRYWRRR